MMNGLEFIRLKDLALKDGSMAYSGNCYWVMDITGVFLESPVYVSKMDAVNALVSNTITWKTISINYREF